jgi:hypothetical protein
MRAWPCPTQCEQFGSTWHGASWPSLVLVTAAKSSDCISSSYQGGGHWFEPQLAHQPERCCEALWGHRGRWIVWHGLRDEIELRAGELAPRGDAELPEYLPQVVVDGVRAEVELGGDLRVGSACCG